MKIVVTSKAYALSLVRTEQIQNKLYSKDTQTTWNADRDTVEL